MTGVVKKTIEQIAREKRRRRQVALALAIIFATLLLGFGVAAINETLGSFTINLKYQNRNMGVSICDNRQMQGLTTYLAAEKAPNITNITYEWLPAGIDGTDGAHNGKTIDDLNVEPEEYEKLVADDGSPKTLYLAYTFYIHNVYMTDGVNYTMSLDITRKTKNADKAVRVLLIQDSEYYGYVEYDKDTKKIDLKEPHEVIENGGNKRVRTIYGALAADGQTETCNSRKGYEGDPDEKFSSEAVVFNISKDGKDSKGNQIMPCGLPQGYICKYTIVVYFEGWDPECDEYIMGGSVKMDLNIDVQDL